MRLDWVNSHTPIHPLYYKRTIPGISDDEAKLLADKKLKDSISKQRHRVGAQNPAHRSNTTLLQRKQRSPKCIEFYELRYPDSTHEQHLQMLTEHMALTKSRVTRDKIVSCPEYWEAHGVPKSQSAQAALDWQHAKPQWSKQYCIEKYGPEIGMEVFNSRNKKWIDKLHQSFINFGDGRSCQSKAATKLFKYLYKKLGITYPKHEKFITVGGRCWALDFFYDDKVIEFNGDYWHANPKIYTENFINKVSGKSAKEIWARDAQKLTDCQTLGYKVMIVWEDEFNNDPQTIIQKCMQFLEI